MLGLAADGGASVGLAGGGEAGDALVSGPRGLECYEAILAEAPTWLAEAGAVVAEIGATQARAVADLARAAGFAEVTVHPDEPVRLDPRLTASALAHLLENAAQYAPAGTPIDVRAGVVGDRLEISVRDHGPGPAA